MTANETLLSSSNGVLFSLSFSFLDVLAARKDPAGLSGEVLINGALQPPNFKCLSGYVVQVQCMITILRCEILNVFGIYMCIRCRSVYWDSELSFLADHINTLSTTFVVMC